ncbi:twin-arginine translocation signal domain-containing protein [Rouxiella badensis]|uniref:Twin-arginine translocation signal domain-containing protein n=1 Tax=Rahnella perminowiae TaxID=2816244 RepID=A0ABS6L1V6_9GAMM|nr:hypothetical protein CI789_05980 [Erwinia persicina]MBU9809797.1 twin-arginine translocation signal domain-containing protein [Rahnella perminowiae]MBU9858531.1 twin-arginine translocation signal domain-containing protein [Rahnella aceris]MCC3705143.1 twin-arginine translocation signal domain-containing protein [Rouxiella badensis]MBU9814947.1 twin-arginine translocation signal domain-containing protein [Rahnella perminowiae]
MPHAVSRRDLLKGASIIASSALTGLATKPGSSDNTSHRFEISPHVRRDFYPDAVFLRRCSGEALR